MARSDACEDSAAGAGASWHAWTCAFRWKEWRARTLQASGCADARDERSVRHRDLPSEGFSRCCPSGGGAPRDSLTGPENWGATRSASEAEFTQSAEQLAAGGKAAAVARQLTSGAKPAPALPSVAGAATEPTGDIDVTSQVDAAQDAYEKPATARTAVVTVLITPAGRIDSLEIAVPREARALTKQPFRRSGAACASTSCARRAGLVSVCRRGSG